jgi:hypothetical protein
MVEKIIGVVLSVYIIFLVWGVWFGNDDDNE